MRFSEKRKLVMSRSIALGHCVCNPKKPCPCDTLINEDLCPCAGERPDAKPEAVRLTQHVEKPGCASKINRRDLSIVLAGLPTFDDPNVLIGVAAGDDAGVYQLPGEWNLVQTVDVFSPVVDDPYTFGRISAANSVSDVYAMGGRPICALSIIGFPIEELPHAVVTEILRGGVEAMWEAGVSVIGGHSINDPEIKCGFAVTGLVEGTGSITNGGAQAGDVLVLTKPIGTGLLSFGMQVGRVSDAAMELAGKSMATLNRDAAELMHEHGAHACTDVTGFSLLGHLSMMAEHSGVSARVELADVPYFAEAVGCVRRGVIPGAVLRNRESFADGVRVEGEGDDALVDLLFDAQTSGGLLVALPPERAEHYVAAMHERGHKATAAIGTITPRESLDVVVVLGEPHRLVGEDCAPAAPTEAACRETAVSCCDAPPEIEITSCCDTPPVFEEETSMDSSNISSAEAFQNLQKAANAPGKVDARSKRLAAIALSIAMKCEPCLVAHVKHALAEGITRDEIEEMAWLATSFSGCTGRMFFQEVMAKLR